MIVVVIINEHFFLALKIVAIYNSDTQILCIQYITYILISTIHGLIMDPHNSQLPVGPIA